MWSTVSAVTLRPVLVAAGDDVVHPLAVEQLVDEPRFIRQVAVEDDAAHGGAHQPFLRPGGAEQPRLADAAPRSWFVEGGDAKGGDVETILRSPRV